MVRQEADSANIQLFSVTSGFVDKGYDFGSDKVHVLKAPKVALVTGTGINSEAAGEVWHFFERQLEYPITLINADDLDQVKWSDFDVLIMPDGYYRFLNDKGSTDQFKDWISKGGRVVALERAVVQLAKADIGLHAKKEDEPDDKSNKDSIYNALKKFSDRDREAASGSTPGAIIKVTMDNSHPLAFGYPEYYYTLKQDDNIYEFLKEDGWNVGIVKKDEQVAGFVGAKLKTKLKDGLLFGVQDIGRGTVTFLSDNIMFRSFWENGKLMFCNSIFLGRAINRLNNFPIPYWGVRYFRP